MKCDMVNGKQRLNVCACANAVMACHEDVRTKLLDKNNMPGGVEMG